MSQGRDALEVSKQAWNKANDGGPDTHLDAKRHDRNYNPVDEAQRSTVSEKLNQDSAKYRKGPNPQVW